jgi:predicted nucleic acid-binding protein
VNAVFVDTSVFLLAAGGPHPDRDPCRSFLARVQASGVRLHISVEAIQEFVSHRMRRTERVAALREIEALIASCVVHPFDEALLMRALALMASTEIRGRDAVHAAAALEAGFETLVSLDKDFDGVPGLTRVAPGDAVA